MNRRELIGKIKQTSFEPFELITSNGERYQVRHPELIHLTDRGTVYVFRPSPRGEEGIESGPDVLSMMHVTSLEPIRSKVESAADEA